MGSGAKCAQIETSGFAIRSGVTRRGEEGTASEWKLVGGLTDGGVGEEEDGGGIWQTLKCNGGSVT